MKTLQLVEHKKKKKEERELAQTRTPALREKPAHLRSESNIGGPRGQGGRGGGEQARGWHCGCLHCHPLHLATPDRWSSNPRNYVETARLASSHTPHSHLQSQWPSPSRSALAEPCAGAPGRRKTSAAVVGST